MPTNTATDYLKEISKSRAQKSTDRQNPGNSLIKLGWGNLEKAASPSNV
jgi:hypothetical protein